MENRDKNFNLLPVSRKDMNMSQLEYGLKTGGLTEKEIIRIFEKALNKYADESKDPCISKGRKKMKKDTNCCGICNPDAAVQPEYDYRYYFNHRYCRLFLELYPNTDKNGLVKFQQNGIVWNLYISDYNDNSVTRELLENLDIDAPEGFGINVLREIFKTLECEKIFIKEYIGNENRL